MSATAAWELLYALRLRHGYYDTDTCPLLQIAPTVECLALLRRFGCRQRSVDGGAEVWFDTTLSPPAISRLPESAALRFALVARDPAIFTITDLPQPPGGAGELLQYFSARATRAEGDALVFQPPAGTSLPAKSAAFRHRFATTQTAETVSVADPLDGSRRWQGAAPAGPFQDLSLDLRGLAEGRYTLHLDGAAVLDFFLTLAPPPFGLIEIWPTNTSLPMATRLVHDATTIQPQSYEARFSARSVIWRYAVFGLGDRHAKITNGAGSAAFSGPVEEIIGGKPATVFTSDIAMPLHQSAMAAYRFRLTWSDSGGVQHEQILAIPSARDVSLDRGPKGAFHVSTMYVFL